MTIKIRLIPHPTFLYTLILYERCKSGGSAINHREGTGFLFFNIYFNESRHKKDRSNECGPAMNGLIVLA